MNNLTLCKEITAVQTAYSILKISIILCVCHSFVALLFWCKVIQYHWEYHRGLDVNQWYLVGAVSIKGCCLTSIGIPIIKISWCDGHENVLSLKWDPFIPGKTVFLFIIYLVRQGSDCGISSAMEMPALLKAKNICKVPQNISAKLWWIIHSVMIGTVMIIPPVASFISMD